MWLSWESITFATWGVVGSNPIISTTEMTRASGNRGPLFCRHSVRRGQSVAPCGRVVGCKLGVAGKYRPYEGRAEGMWMDATTGKALMRAQF